VGVGWCICVGGCAGVGESVRTIESVRVCEGEEREKIGLSAMLKLMPEYTCRHFNLHRDTRTKALTHKDSQVHIESHTQAHTHTRPHALKKYSKVIDTDKHPCTRVQGRRVQGRRVQGGTLMQRWLMIHQSTISGC